MTEEEREEYRAKKREEDRIDFRNATEDVLIRCSEWLAKNASDLADRFAGGCRKWSVGFGAGEDGLFPDVHVSVNKYDYDVISPYIRILDNGMPDDIGSAFGSEIYDESCDEEWKSEMDKLLEKDKERWSQAKNN